MHINRSLILASLVSVVVVALSGQVFSATVAVGNCTALVNYATIQQAVNAVPAGSTIKVCPGNYREQVVIGQKVTLSGIVYANQDLAIILPPTTGLAANAVSVDSGNPIAAQIFVQNTVGPVVINNLTVDGSVVTGIWVEQTADDGYYRGARYHGAIQLLVEPTGRRIAGKWVGFGKEMGINTGPWELIFQDASTDKATLDRSVQ